MDNTCIHAVSFAGVFALETKELTNSDRGFRLTDTIKDLGNCLQTTRILLIKDAMKVRAAQQSIANIWIELRPTIFQKLFSHDIRAQCLTIGTIRCHSIDCVCKHDDTRTNRNRSTCKPIRISCTVIILVVMSHSWNNVCQLSHACHKVCTLHRMQFHNRSFLRSKLPGLLKNRKENLINLSNIVQQRCYTDPLDLTCGKP